MSDEWLTSLLKWSLLVGPCLLFIVWAIWEDEVRPRLIPQEEIDRICRSLIAEHGARAISITYLEEDRASCEADSYTAAKWRRVRSSLLIKLSEPPISN